MLESLSARSGVIYARGSRLISAVSDNTAEGRKSSSPAAALKWSWRSRNLEGAQAFSALAPTFPLMCGTDWRGGARTQTDPENAAAGSKSRLPAT